MARHEQIERLIPWYVNGTLNETEMDLVNRHLGRCRRCAASVEREVRFARQLRAEPADLHALAHPLAAWGAFARRLPRERPRAAPVAALLAAVMVIAGGSFLVGQHLQPPVFRAMTTSLAYDGPVVQLVFEPDVPEHTIRGVVLELGGTVIAGPTSTGVYRIGLPPGSDGAARLARLDGLPAVRWASLEEP